MSGNDDAMIRRMAKQAQQQGQALTVAAPFNDVQLLAMVAAAIYRDVRDVDNPARAAAEQAVEIVAHAATAVRGGDLNRAMQRLLAAGSESEPAQPALVEN